LHTVDVVPPRSSRHTPPPIEPPSRDHFTWDMTPISSALDSSYHSAIPRKQRRFATGWVEHSKYIPHGHIEELSLDRPTNYETSCVQRPRPFEHPYSNMLPPDTTPPPTPDQRFVPLPPVHADDYASDWNAHQHPSSIEQQNQDEGDDFDESVLLLIRDCVNATQEMLSMLCTSFPDSRSHRTAELQARVEAYYRLVHASLHAVQRATGHLDTIDKSPSRLKLTDMLFSIHRTLTKLLKLADSTLLGVYWPLDINKVTQKLQGYSNKLSNVFSTISASLDKLPSHSRRRSHDNDRPQMNQRAMEQLVYVTGARNRPFSCCDEMALSRMARRRASTSM
jgi:hypothetical protein